MGGLWGVVIVLIGVVSLRMGELIRVSCSSFRGTDRRYQGWGMIQEWFQAKKWID
jgi:hypothetical protein